VRWNSAGEPKCDTGEGKGVRVRIKTEMGWLGCEDGEGRLKVCSSHNSYSIFQINQPNHLQKHILVTLSLSVLLFQVIPSKSILRPDSLGSFATTL
jgi:hypothetical protein